MSFELYKGQKLMIKKTNELVTVVSFNEKSIRFVYKDKTYTRKRSLIGKTLFPLECDAEHDSRSSWDSVDKASLFSEYEKSTWPKVGDASFIRTKKRW